MSVLQKLKKMFSGEQDTKSSVISSCGMLVFEHTSAVIAAETSLKAAGYGVEVKAPPPNLHKGCDMILIIELMHEIAILKLLKEQNNAPVELLPMAHDLLEPVSLYQVHDFGQWLMVRAANMKITVDKQSQIIVNISGGGCPDVPYLAHKLIGLELTQAMEPREMGHTLCCYALQKAFLEARRILTCG